MVMRVASNIKLCKECRHLTDAYPRFLNTCIKYSGLDFLNPDTSELSYRLITLECPHWFDEALDNIGRELDG